jgi:hypothetical protein
MYLHPLERLWVSWVSFFEAEFEGEFEGMSKHLFAAEEAQTQVDAQFIVLESESRFLADAKRVTGRYCMYSRHPCQTPR